MGLEYTVLFHRLLGMHTFNDRLTFCECSACDMQIAQNVVILRAFMRNNLCDAAGANDQDIAFHVSKRPLTFVCYDNAAAKSS